MPQFFDVRGEWDAFQSNGFVVHFFSMKQVLRPFNAAFTDITGRASHSGGAVQGNVSGAVSGNHFHVLVHWEVQPPSVGEYTGTFGLLDSLPGGVPRAPLTGFSHDQMHPESQATWFASGFLLADF